jgi:branched-chain amino acid transport system permease protein
MAILAGVLIGGVAFGAIYAMMAIGFSLLWQTSRTINFAQGDFVTVVGFLFIGLAAWLGLGPGIAAAGAIVGGVLLLGVLVRKVLVARLINHGVLSLVVATIALSILIQNFIVVAWTPQALRPPNLVGQQTLQIAGVPVNLTDVVNLAVASLMIVALQAFLGYTKTGKALRATAQNAGAARVLGIEPERMITLAFVINAVLVGVAAVLLVPIFLVQYNMGTALGLNAFYAAIIGGFNRIRGALVGGVLVGVIESVSAAYISTQYQTAIVVACLMAILLVKPEGLLGEKELVAEYQG